MPVRCVLWSRRCCLVSKKFKFVFFQRATHTFVCDALKHLEFDDLICDHAQRPDGFVIGCARAGDLDDLRFNMTVEFDRLTFVFTGFAMNGSVKCLGAKLFSGAFNGMFFNFKIFCDLLVGVLGTVGVGSE